ncbi:MAG: SIS domain-containing protein [Lachnospiraceae bacterium]|nr:SIS domain-containing protein [Lachnospiraceae bacterium]
MREIEGRLKKHIEELTERYPALEGAKESIIKAYLIMEENYERDGKLLIAGNGGSAADAEHIAGELMKRFQRERPIPKDLSDRLIGINEAIGSKLSKNLERPLMAVPLTAHEALTTAYINDADGHGVFAQQLYGYGRKGDVFLAISTSGNSINILNTAVLARALDIKVIALTGENGGELMKYADVCVRVPEKETYKIQELHLPVYHAWCMMLEDHFFC